MFILFALGSLIALFAFTLGVHLGKKQTLEHPANEAPMAGSNSIETHADEVPTNLEMSEQIKGAQGAAIDSLNQELQNEVAETGIKLEKNIQVELPDQTKVIPTEKASAPSQSEAFKRKAPTGKFTLQVGSFANAQEAEQRAKILTDGGLEPFLRQANIRGKGYWFRIYLGGFNSIKEAKSNGSQFVQQGKIDSFVVAPMPGV